MLKQRNSSVEIEKITNGFVLSVSGTDENEEWCMDKIYEETLEEVLATAAEYFALPERK